jgi:pimeloyl-ACP methyl ester carboxylesterase
MFLSAAYAQDIAGDWQGTLKVGPTSLPTVVHFTADGHGGFTGTVDSPAQGATGIPITSISLKASKLNWSARSIAASYEGKVDAGGKLIRGTFSQGGEAFPLDFQRMAAKAPAKPSDIDGTWLGTLDVGMKLRVVIHITNTADGLTATMDSPDQNAAGIPVSSITRSGATFKLEIQVAAASFEGKINPALDAIDGTFTQRGAPLPLVFHRVKGDAIPEPKRPQLPVKPYPYREEHVTYRNPSAGIELAATFTIPQGKGPFPAAILIAGSGPHDRDETIFGHKPFLVLADYLTRHGIAVLRADKRGIGKSGGNYAAATTLDFASDAEAGIAWLKTRPEADPRNVGLIGHSEGGIVAPMVAARNRDVAFFVTLAGPGVRGDELLPLQVIAGNEAAGMSHADALKDGDTERAALKIIESATDPAKLREKLAPLMSQAEIDSQFAVVTSPWFRFLLQYDPAADLRKVTCAVLALNGSKDTQVVASQNLPAIRAALQAGGNRRFEIVEFPGLNHLFQTAKSGAVGEYGDIEETMSPAVLSKIATWIAQHP